MDDLHGLTQTEQLLLMAAAVQGLGPRADLGYANTWRIVDQTLRWLGLSAKEVRQGWRETPTRTVHEEVYKTLVRMTRQKTSKGPWRPPERPGKALFDGGGNWGVPGDPDRPPAWPRYNSCHLTRHGERIAQLLLERHPQLRKDG